MGRFPVDIWTIPLSDECPEILSRDEAERAQRFRFDRDRIRWIRARSSLRRVLSRYAGTGAANLSFHYGTHGKPSLPEFPSVEFNLSHAGDWAMIAVTRAVPVGIDIERMRPGIEMAALLERLGERDLPETQSSLYQRWTVREARSKAAGGALFDAPSAETHAMPLTSPDGYSAAVALTGFIPEPRYQ